MITRKEWADMAVSLSCALEHGCFAPAGKRIRYDDTAGRAQADEAVKRQRMRLLDGWVSGGCDETSNQPAD